jgi:tetratricopeptide (TPR) repeat protein
MPEIVIEAPALVRRESQLRLVDELVSKKGELCVLGVQGEGGIGKTVLLQEVRRTYAKRRGFLVSEVLDFDESENWVHEVLSVRVAKVLGETAFKRYIDEVNEYHRLRAEGAPFETVEEKDRELRNTFVECYNDMAAESRVILLLDTVEIIQNTEAFTYWLQLLPQLENSVVILAGRETNELKLFLEADEFALVEVRFETLTGFSREETDRFFEADDYGREVDEDTREKTWLLADGRPILIALALKWLEREVSLESFLGMSKLDIERRKQEMVDRFKAELVRGVRFLADPLPIAILSAAHSRFRFDAEMASSLLDIGLEEAQELIETLSTFFFAKLRGDGIVLHDEMRDMVVEYIWTPRDPNGEERAEISKNIARYYEEKIKRYGEKPQLYELAATVPGIPSRLRPVLLAERVYHLLFSDLKNNYSTLGHLIDEAYHRHDDDAMIFLIERAREVQKLRPVPDLTLGRIITSSEGWLHLLLQHTDRAQAIFEEMLEREIPIQKRIEASILNALGDCANRKGEMGKAVDHYERALNVYKQIEPEARTTGLSDGLQVSPEEVRREQAELVKSIGYIRRRQGRWKEAGEVYKQARSSAQEAGDEAEVANIDANISNILRYQGRIAEAFRYAEMAYRTRMKLGLKQALGLSHSLFGLLYRDAGDTERAAMHFAKALAAFEETGDWNGAVRAYRNLGVLSHSLRGPESAIVHFERALAMCDVHGIERERPLTINKLAIACRDSEQLDRAFTLMERSLALAKQYGDMPIVVDSAYRLAEMYYKHKHDEDKAYEYIQAVEELKEEGYPFVEIFAATEALLAQMAMAKEQYEKAFHHYFNSLAYLADYSKGKLRLQLGELREKLRALDGDLVEKYCTLLAKQWQKKFEGPEYADVLQFCKDQIQAVKATT